MKVNIKNSQYKFISANLNGIRNQNEKRITELLPEILNEFSDFKPDVIDIQDIYALSLNLLPAFYTQKHTIVYNNPITDQLVREAIRKAIEIVWANPRKEETTLKKNVNEL